MLMDSWKDLQIGTSQDVGSLRNIAAYTENGSGRLLLLLKSE